jgi:hypothetical protein
VAGAQSFWDWLKKIIHQHFYKIQALLRIGQGCRPEDASLYMMEIADVVDDREKSALYSNPSVKPTRAIPIKKLLTSKTAKEIFVFFAFVVLTLVMTWPWALHVRDYVSDPGDPYLNGWTLWWDYYGTFHHPLSFFQANIFYPYKYSLAFSEHYYGIAVFFFPLFALGVRPLTIVSLATLLGFAYSGYGAFRLGRTLTGSTAVGWVTGLTFAFAPYRFGQLAHLGYLYAGWIPITLEALVLFARERSWKRAIWLGTAFLFNGLSCIHWLVLTIIPFGVSTIFLVYRHSLWRDRAFWLRAALTIGIAALILFPFLYPYTVVAKLYGFVRSPEETLGFSAEPVHWLVGSFRSKLWQGLNQSARTGERELFPGLLPVLFGAGALLLSSRSEPSFFWHRNPPVKRFLPLLDAIAVAAAILSVLALGPDGFKLELFHHRVVSIHEPGRALTILIAALMVRVAISYPKFFQGARSHSLVATLKQSIENPPFSEGIWLGVIWVALGFWGSLGLNSSFHTFLFEHISVFRSIRVPARWAMICVLGLSLLTGIGVVKFAKAVSAGFSPWTLKIVILILCGTILFEQRVAPLDLYRGEADPDELTLRLKQTPMAAGIVELPFDQGLSQYLYTLRAADHARPLITAFSGFSPGIGTKIQELTGKAKIPDSFMDLLESIPCSYLVVHNEFLVPERRLAMDEFLYHQVLANRLTFVRNYEKGSSSEDLYAVMRTEPLAKAEVSIPEPYREALLRDAGKKSGGTRSIDDPSFFVETQYQDFFNRKGDSEGVGFWTSKLLFCGKDKNCERVHRASVSASFLTAKEFDRSAFFLYRIYRTSLGRAPTYAEFKHDRAKIDSEFHLDETTLAFLKEWINRPEFKKKYSDLSSSGFVDALIANVKRSSNMDLVARRESLVKMSEGGAPRYEILKQIVEDETFSNAERSPGYLTLAFFTYLHRDPDSGGFAYWQNRFNDDLLDDFQPMVQAFIESEEYRLRFSDGKGK